METETQALIRQTACAFAQEVLAPGAAARELAGRCAQ